MILALALSEFRCRFHYTELNTRRKDFCAMRSSSTIQVVESASAYARRQLMSRTTTKPEDAPELATLKKYLRWRVRRWTAETPMGQEPRQQRDFARLSGLSPGTVSGIINGGTFAETAVSGILKVLKLSWPDAFKEAEKWRAASGGHEGGPSAAMRDAIAAYEVRTGKKVGEKAKAMLVVTERRAGATWTVKEWLAEIPGVVTVVEHFPERLDSMLEHGDVAGHALSRATKPRGSRASNRKTDNDR